MAPSERTASFHGLRVHFQIINWKLLRDTEEDFHIKAEDWGWKVKDSTMYAIKTDQAIAPEVCSKLSYATAELKTTMYHELVLLS